MSLKKGDKIISGLVTIEAVREAFYPVGSVVMGDNLVDENTVKSIYGGAEWTQITGAIYGVGEQVTAVGSVEEQMPKMGFSGDSGNFIIENRYYNSYIAAPVDVDGTSGIVSIANSSVTTNVQLSMTQNTSARKSKVVITPTGTITGGNQVEDGHIMAKGIATYAWKRTA